MNILLTNDDGITSEGLQVLAEHLRRDHDVWIVAPDKERSAVSHCITFREPVKFHRVADRQYACSGTPADCVLYACHGAVPVRPDLVISGINRGENIGTDIMFSGTVAAARQAVFLGLPGIAVSSGARIPSYHEAALLVSRELPRLLELSSKYAVININVPDAFDPARGMVTTIPCIKDGGNEVNPYYRNENEVYYFLSEFREDHVRPTEGFTDADALKAGMASITPIAVQPTVHPESITGMSKLYPGENL